MEGKRGLRVVHGSSFDASSDLLLGVIEAICDLGVWVFWSA